MSGDPESPVNAPKGEVESLASRWFERAYAWLAGPRDALPLGAARAGLGLTLLLAYLQYLPYAHTFFGPHGIGGHDTLARHRYFFGITFEWYTRIRVLHLVTSGAVIWALYVGLLLAAAAFAVGLYARVSGAVAAVLHMLFYAHNPMVDGGWGALLGPFIVYLVLSDCGAQLSVDAWRKRRRGDTDTPTPQAAPWGMRLLQVHLCVMYLMPGFERLDAEGWVRGEMVLRSLANMEYGRYEVNWNAFAGPLRVLTWLVLVIEPAAPILLWLRGVGRYWALLLIVMHTSLELMLDTGWWQFMMIAALLTFLPPAWLRRVIPAAWRQDAR